MVEAAELVATIEADKDAELGEIESRFPELWKTVQQLWAWSRRQASRALTFLHFWIGAFLAVIAAIIVGLKELDRINEPEIPFALWLAVKEQVWDDPFIFYSVFAFLMMLGASLSWANRKQ